MNPRSAPLHLVVPALWTWFKPVAASLAMAAALQGPGSAQASPVTSFSGSASIGNLRISVVDLDLNDGIAAGYAVVNPNGHHAETVVWESWSAGAWGPGAVSTQTGAADWWTTNLNAGHVSPHFSGQASILGGLAAASLQTSGYEFDRSIWADWMSFRPDANGHVGNWLLAAHTRLVITADAQVQDQLTGCAVLGCVSASDTVAGLEAGMFGDIDIKVDDFLGLYRFVQYDGIQQSTLSDSLHRTVTVTLDNSGAQSRLGYVRLAAGAWAYSYAISNSDVPEPNSLVLTALGMAALWRQRAAKRKNAQASARPADFQVIQPETSRAPASLCRCSPPG